MEDNLGYVTYTQRKNIEKLFMQNGHLKIQIFTITNYGIIMTKV